MSSLTQPLLVVYAGISTTAFAAAILWPVFGGTGRFEEIEVQRLNLVEADGTLRLVIANTARMPGIIDHGVEIPHPSGPRGAAVLFFNEEGSETGGIRFDGKRGPDGAIESIGGFMIDQYGQNEAVGVFKRESKGSREVGLLVNDRPDRPILDDLKELPRLRAMPPAEREKLRREREESAYYGALRAFVGRATDGAAEVRLKDAKGRDRLVLRVAAEGAAALEFLDEKGAVIERLPGNPRAAP